MRRRRTAVLAGLVAASFFIAACGSSDDSGAPGDAADPAANTSNDEGVGGADAAKQLNALYEAAKKADNKSVIIYGPILGDVRSEPLIHKFEQRYSGIDVKATSIYGADLAAKLNQEVSGGHHVADLIASAAGDIARNGDKLEPYVPFTATELAKDDQMVCKADVGIAISVTAVGIGYNTKLVSKDDAPKSLQDLLDPKWKGKIVQDQPLNPGHGIQMAIYMLQNGFDLDYFKSLAAQKPTLVKGSSAVTSRLAQGQAAIAIPAASDDMPEANDKGAPVAFVAPEEGAVRSINCYGLLKDAPHSEAAKLFIAWLYTPEAQEVYAKKLYKYSVLSEVAPPKGLPALDKIKFWDKIPAEEYNQFQTTVTPKFKDIYQ